MHVITRISPTNVTAFSSDPKNRVVSESPDDSEYSITAEIVSGVCSSTVFTIAITSTIVSITGCRIDHIISAPSSNISTPLSPSSSSSAPPPLPSTSSGVHSSSTTETPAPPSLSLSQRLELNGGGVFPSANNSSSDGVISSSIKGSSNNEPCE